MRTSLTRQRALSAAAPAAILAFGLVSGAIADPSATKEKPAHPAHHAVAQHAVHVRHHLARRDFVPGYDGAAGSAFGYAGPARATLPPGAIQFPGYVYMPGQGILDEACNLPTSTCPNSQRDIQ